MYYGKIYRINFADGKSYVGSTHSPYMSKRIRKHKDQELSKNGFTQEVSKRFTDNIDYDYEILKEDLFFNKYDLLYWERIFTELTPNTLNKRRCWRTTEEEQEQIKTTKKNSSDIYREKNKDKINEKKSQKFICECGKEYQHSNKARHIRSKFHQNFIINLK